MIINSAPNDNPTKLSELNNDKGFITGYIETDPNVPTWAKTASKPTYTATEVGAAPTSHNHSANEITSGTLPVSRGGTGNTSVDTTPTSGSTKMVTSGGVYTALSGKAASSHNQAASTITAGTLGGQVKANATAAATVGTAQVRNIYAGTSDMTAGTSALTTGDIYFVYE